MGVLVKGHPISCYAELAHAVRVGCPRSLQNPHVRRILLIESPSIDRDLPDLELTIGGIPEPGRSVVENLPPIGTDRGAIQIIVAFLVGEKHAEVDCLIRGVDRPVARAHEIRESEACTAEKQRREGIAPSGREVFKGFHIFYGKDARTVVRWPRFVDTGYDHCAFLARLVKRADIQILARKIHGSLFHRRAC